MLVAEFIIYVLSVHRLAETAITYALSLKSTGRKRNILEISPFPGNGKRLYIIELFLL